MRFKVNKSEHVGVLAGGGGGQLYSEVQYEHH